MSGFFSGMVPRVMRRTLMASMAWTVYEQVYTLYMHIVCVNGYHIMKNTFYKKYFQTF